TLDFLTTPGYLKGGNSREESGLPAGTGPYKIITNMAVMDFAPDSKRMRVISLNPDYRFEDVQDNCGFELLQVDEIQQTKPPTDVELKILREEVDPNRYVIGR
ncbi:MAG: 3-oxoacid CoA-transferase, partial [Deltaproteobacteria bacterium]|nr:3-oxoacid CoA-transferase [Deltaproteobacteria bacterium]